jgi:hypothetical protein
LFDAKLFSSIDRRFRDSVLFLHSFREVWILSEFLHFLSLIFRRVSPRVVDIKYPMMVTSQNRWIVLFGRHGHFRKADPIRKKRSDREAARFLPNPNISFTFRTNIPELEGESLSPVPRAKLLSTAHLRSINLRPRRPVTSLCSRQFFKIPGSVLFCVLRTLCAGPVSTPRYCSRLVISYIGNPYLLCQRSLTYVFARSFLLPLSTCSGRRLATLLSLDRI